MRELIVTTSWDDGHILDIKLARLLTKYGIKGTFYISPKNHEFHSKDLLSQNDLLHLNKKFELGAHTYTHVHLPMLSSSEAKEEIVKSKIYLERLIKKTVTAFCYPYGEYSKETIQIVKSARFLFARTTKRYSLSFTNTFEMPTTIHAYGHIKDLFTILKLSKFNPITFISYLNWENLAKDMFDRALITKGVYHLWGHSWEIEKNNDWKKLERVLQYISHRTNALYKTNSESVYYLNKRRKKILITTPYFYPRTGGLENYVLNITKQLYKNHSLEVVIVTTNTEGNKIQTEIINGIKVYRLPYLFKVSNTPINPFWYFTLKKIIHEENPDIINAHAPVPFMADITSLVVRDVPFVLTYHAGTMKKEKFIFDIIINLYQKLFLTRLFRKANKIICASSFVKNTIAKNFIEKCEVITPAVDLSTFKPSHTIKKEKRVLFICRYANMYPMKGFHYLITAMAQLPNIQLVIVGEKGKTNLKNVSFIGLKTGKDLVKEIHKSTIVVLPSLAHMESFGMVLLEAMACKTAVIGTNIGGIPEVIKNGEDGILVASKDSISLKNAIQEIINNPDFEKMLVKNAYKKVLASFTWNIQADKTYKLLQNL